ncbi:MAG: hypothetical protein AVDCRST_MAG18-34, partial [uncultured Thermomicrobiales bacterium]
DPPLPRSLRPRLLPARWPLYLDGAGGADRRAPRLRRARRRHRDRGRLQLGHRGDRAGAGRALRLPRGHAARTRQGRAH